MHLGVEVTESSTNKQHHLKPGLNPLNPTRRILRIHWPKTEDLFLDTQGPISTSVYCPGPGTQGPTSTSVYCPGTAQLLIQKFREFQTKKIRRFVRHTSSLSLSLSPSHPLPVSPLWRGGMFSSSYACILLLIYMYPPPHLLVSSSSCACILLLMCARETKARER